MEKEKEIAGNTQQLRLQVFSVQPGINPVVAAIAANIKRQDEQRDFIPKLITRAGFPLWSKSKVITHTDARKASAARGQNANEQMIFIPFVPENSNSTRAILTVKITGPDTLFRLLYNTEYSQFNFGEPGTAEVWNAKDIFHAFIVFDYEIFEHSKFRILDPKLLPGNNAASGNDSSTITITNFNNSQARSSSYYEETICIDYTVCYKCPPLYARNTSVNSLSSDCCYPEYYTTCITWWFDDDNGDWGWYSGGGAGGGSGPCTGNCNWENEDPCEDNDDPQPLTANRDPESGFCDEGWEPLEQISGIDIFGDWNISFDDVVKIEYWKRFNIDSSGLDSCRRAILNKLISKLGTSPLGILLTKIGKSIGEPSNLDNFILHFLTQPLSSQAAVTTKVSYQNGEFEADIILDSTVSVTATELYIANTFIHEIVHAYLSYLLRKILSGTTDEDLTALGYGLVFNEYIDSVKSHTPSTSFPYHLVSESYQHNYMANKLLEFMAKLLEDFDNSSIPDKRYYWYMAWSGLTRPQVKTWKTHWPNYPAWPPTNPSPSEDSTRGLKFALTLSRIDSIYNKVLENESRALPGALGKKPIPGGCY